MAYRIIGMSLNETTRKRQEKMKYAPGTTVTLQEGFGFRFFKDLDIYSLAEARTDSCTWNLLVRDTMAVICDQTYTHKSNQYGYIVVMLPGIDGNMTPISIHKNAVK